jgi:hypothetical protein
MRRFALALAALAVAGRSEPADFPSRDDNFVDYLLAKAWKGAARAPLSDDAEFLRRVTLDVIGRIPTVDETTSFLADRSPRKRDRKILDLLTGPEFAPFWGERLASILLGYPTGYFNYTKPQLARWISVEIRDGASIDEMVRKMIGIGRRGDTAGFVNHYLMQAQNPQRVEDLVGRISRVFLGVPLQCAQCHDHPFDRWTQEDFEGMVGFFRHAPNLYGVQYKKKYGDPVFLDGTRPASGPSLGEFAELLTRRENPRFARTFVNRIWAHFFGRGLVEPLDDLNERNGPVLGGVLEPLALRFAKGGHRFKSLIQWIAGSRGYQATSREAPGVEAPFATARVRPLSPEQLLGAISAATDLPAAVAKAKMPRQEPLNPIQGQGLEFVRAWFIREITRTGHYDATSRSSDYTANIQQILRLADLKSVVYAGARADTGGTLSRILDRRLLPRDAVEEIYLAVLSRRPSPSEVRRCLAHVLDRPDAASGYEDIFWALLNSNEFYFNH